MKVETQATQRFHTGQTVWVRNLQEILDTLDVDGKLDGLPFMPEMTQYCGRSFRISCLPTKTCIEGVGFHGLTGVAFLENLRCKGESHDGCQRDCLFFWHEAWLGDQALSEPGDTTGSDQPALKTKQGERYFCQSTELAGVGSEYRAVKSGPLGTLKKIIIDVWRGEMTISAFIAKVFNAILSRVMGLLGMDTSGRVLGQRQKTEALNLGLQPGEWVEVKTRKEIKETLDVNGKNRGLLFDTPMAEYFGQRFQVECQLQKIILEETGQMITLTNTVLLQDNVCTAWSCPRANRPFWREIWLKRVSQEP